MKIAPVAYTCERFPGWVAHQAKLERLFAATDADLIVLPEYAALEAAMVGNTPALSPLEWRDLGAERAGQWVDQLCHLAQVHRRHILAGSGPVLTPRGYVNRAWLITPEGAVGFQDKLILTPYERAEMTMVPGEDLTLFDTALGKIGILICYDSEFPLLARALVAAGAEMILVPSCTDLPAGQTRVRQSCRARAIEGQCLIVQAPLVGAMPGCDIIDGSTGRAGVFCPPDYGLPSDGIVAQGETDVPGPVTADVDPALIAAPRMGGQVGNFAHWPEQEAPAGKVTLARLAAKIA
jgi:predicted amidohydrolase